MSGTTRVALVTGASTGIGFEVAKGLIERGFSVVATGRDAARCAQAGAELGALAGDPARFRMIRGDLAELGEAAAVAEQVLAFTDRIDVLVNNAGGVCASHRLTSDSHEYTLAGNHLGHFLLTERLLPALRRVASERGPGAARIINVSSEGHRYCAGIDWDDMTLSAGYVPGVAYCRAKLANVLFTRELVRRFASEGIIAHSMHPGVVASNFISHLDDVMRAHMEKSQGDPPEVPAKTILWLATDPEPARSNGLYWHDFKPVLESEPARDDAAAARLWEFSEQALRRAQG